MWLGNCGRCGGKLIKFWDENIDEVYKSVIRTSQGELSDSQQIAEEMNFYFSSCVGSSNPVIGVGKDPEIPPAMPGLSSLRLIRRLCYVILQT